MDKRISRFRKEVWNYWKEHGRHSLPWRKTTDPYRILVSEMMLQQTQVPRVIEKYKSFLKKFPSVKALANASLSEVLKEWSGLGYNRRAKYLHDAARMIATSQPHAKNAVALLSYGDKLPGVGPYTRAAVRVFAFNEPDILIETNIRTVFIHHFFDDKSSVSDKELLPLIEEAAKGQDPRTWHAALMDYGVHLKKLHKNPSRRSAHYTKQSKFEGSLRQVRGAILRELHKGNASLTDLRFSKKKVDTALSSLAHDGLIVRRRGRWAIS